MTILIESFGDELTKLAEDSWVSRGWSRYKNLSKGLSDYGPPRKYPKSESGVEHAKRLQTEKASRGTVRSMRGGKQVGPTRYFGGTTPRGGGTHRVAETATKPWPAPRVIARQIPKVTAKPLQASAHPSYQTTAKLRKAQGMQPSSTRIQPASVAGSSIKKGVMPRPPGSR